MGEQVLRDDDTGEFSTQAGSEDAPPAGEPVGRINMVEEEPPAPPAAPAGSQAAADQPQLLQRILFGVLAVGLMILALVVMLQGVFEQKMPV
jgi:hypothetical protein